MRPLRSNRRGLSIAQLMVSVAIVGFLSLVIAQLFRGILSDTQKTELYNSMSYTQSDVIQITKNLPKWLASLQTISTADATMGEVVKCFNPSGTGCGGLPNQISLVDSVIKSKVPTGYIVTSVNLIDLVKQTSGYPGAQIAGTVSTPLCFDTNGKSLGVTATPTTNQQCRFTASGYLIHQSGANPGSPVIILKIAQNQPVNPLNKNTGAPAAQLTAAPIYLTVLVGNAWQNSVAPAATSSLNATCANTGGRTYTSGWNVGSPGSEINCVTQANRTCGPNQIVGSVSSDGSINCKPDPRKAVPMPFGYNCQVLGPPFLSSPIPTILSPANPAGYTINLGPYTGHCTGVALRVSVIGYPSGATVNIPCRPVSGGSCFDGFQNVPMKTPTQFSIAQSDLAPLDGSTSFAMQYYWQYNSGGPGSTCNGGGNINFKEAYGIALYVSNNSNPSGASPCPGYY